VRRLAKRKWASSTEYGVAERAEGGEHPQLHAQEEGGE
jgi:hypothetical protein